MYIVYIIHVHVMYNYCVTICTLYIKPCGQHHRDGPVSHKQDMEKNVSL